ncbi:type II toxin-antitoxin system RelE family toxin [Desulfolutivibrio sulfoxidireducens]|uniref:type II toxin-antitoxin system RelE family toxin n=1 Tax=Desulfolutivibrio sulfoxidireducens TaxID=2773299 RepID=UPI00159DFA69|nr:type II toxin-antitoxin system RelE/ParE family toxin [Desulfolutivibrio sulfoxidireducens]QLA18683.1 type II toxin-antitoxin system mRNA interferase toxin, RelE/StbE family [Desulfolutivibrio sulfoxidireducens]
MNWKIEFTAEADKTLTRLGREAERRILKFMRERISKLEDPRIIGEPLKGSRFSGLWRYRAGDYRILCEIQDEKIRILVVLVGHRGEIYK